MLKQEPLRKTTIVSQSTIDNPQAEYGDAHRRFLQALMSHGALREDDASKIYGECFEGSEQGFKAFLDAINERVRPLQLEITKAPSEVNGGVLCYVLINQRSTPSTMSSARFSINHYELLKKIIEEIVQAGTGFLSSTACLNLADSLEKRMSKREADEFLTELLEQGWLLDVDGQYCLGARSVCELESYLRDLGAPFCSICKKAVLVAKDQSCTVPECACRKHVYCVRKLTETRIAAARARKAAPEVSCPSCSHDLPLNPKDQNGL